MDDWQNDAKVTKADARKKTKQKQKQKRRKYESSDVNSPCGWSLHKSPGFFA